jgi:DNA-binding MarR family transcriptional regulator
VSEDHVDRIRRESNLARSGEDPIEVVARAFRYCVYLEQQVGAAFSSVGLSRPEADLLAALQRSKERLLPPSRLAAALICSTGTMTNRLDRLENAGFVRRHDDPNDRRGVLIELTSEGRKAITAAVAARDKVAQDLVPGLTRTERRMLAGLLRKMLVEVEELEAGSQPPAVASPPRKKRSLRKARGASSR